MGDHGWAAPGASELDRRAAAPHSARVTWPPSPAGRSPSDVGDPQRASRGRSRLLIGLAVLAGVAVVVGAVTLAVTGVVAGDDSTEDTETWDRGYADFVDPAGQFELSLPAWYAPVSTRGEVAGAGARTFPSDPESAAALDRLIARQPASVMLLVTDGPSVDDRFRMSITLERLAPAGPAGEAGEVDAATGRDALAPAGTEIEGDPIVVELAAGSALRAEYQDPRDDDELVRWYVPDGDDTWVLTFRAADLAEYGGHVDAVADSFDLLDPRARPQADVPPPDDGGRTLVPTQAPEDAFRAAVPQGWVHQFAGTGSPALDEQVFPDDDGAAGRLRDFLSTFTSSETRLVAIDPAGWTVVPNHVVVVDEMPGAEPSATIDELLESARRAWVDAGGLHADEGRLAGAAGEIGWFDVGLPNGALPGVRYVVPGSTSVWVITVWSNDPAGPPAVGDTIATELSPG